ncbi:hypothetical protein GTNG_2278 [Geobacillus thermodenitrificans NG80-2]|uniref:Uncharacterized protein n=1 Tax=Geobacillus thermodenitrificans (strain NG80-2) TaxID=420246 RepID=A4IQM3_GEOTN|nr:hypothetical protein GTNG_2278 [Geobacillus thermodenitrificans NG80-2]
MCNEHRNIHTNLRMFFMLIFFKILNIKSLVGLILVKEGESDTKVVIRSSKEFSFQQNVLCSGAIAPIRKLT